MGLITRFAVRNNGRVLADVRRPVAPKRARVQATKVAEPQPTPVEEIGDSPKRPASNDAKVKTKKSDG